MQPGAAVGVGMKVGPIGVGVGVGVGVRAPLGGEIPKSTSVHEVSTGRKGEGGSRIKAEVVDKTLSKGLVIEFVGWPGGNQ